MYLIQHIIERSAREYPTRPAVVDDEAQLSYAELNALADDFARTLTAAGVRPGDRVGVCARKSPATVAALLGAVKAGAAYVPLDPNAPKARLALIARDCECRALIVDEKSEKRLRAGGVLDVPMISVHGSAAAQERVDRDACDLTRDSTEQSLAYILYTSGSTGAPKGVMIDHRAALTFIEWAGEQFQLNPDDRVSSHAPFHFDLSIFDLFVSFAAGAAVHLIPPEVALFPTRLAQFVAERRITVWYSVPSALIQLTLRGDLPAQDLSALRYVLFAGEVFPLKHLRRLRSLLPGPQYYNLYGPTETNVCTYYRVAELPGTDESSLPIGRACANTRVFLIDDEGNAITHPAPGDEGELCAAGAGVMRGYWNRTAENRKAFLNPEKISQLRERSAYRTGDIVRVDEAGDFRFVGRRDGMIKSRGYRIEIGEVEARLAAHPAVEEGAIVPVPHDEFGNILKACVLIANPDTELTPAGLRAYCAERLPAYMVPDEIILMREFPRTSTGKIDRRALLTEMTGQELIKGGT